MRCEKFGSIISFPTMGLVNITCIWKVRLTRH
jgi:hypothetical protein